MLLQEYVRQSQVLDNTEAKPATQHRLQGSLHTQAFGSIGSYTPKNGSTDGKVHWITSDSGAANSLKTSAPSSALAATDCDNSRNAGAGDPIVVKTNRLCSPDRGRVMVSESFIPKGTLLGRVVPQAAVCDSGNRRRRCGFCLARTVAKTDGNDGDFEAVTSCDDCGEIWYCDETCRSQDWRMIHGYECEFLKDLHREPSSTAGLEWRTADDRKIMTRFGELDPFDQDYCRLLMRILVLRFKEHRFHPQGSPAQPALKGKGIEEEGPQSFADVDDLVENRDSFSKEKIQGDMMDVARVLDVFQGHLQQSQGQRFKDGVGEEKEKGEDVVPRLTLDELLGLICKEECNSFGLYEYAPAASSPTNAKSGYGLGLFIQNFTHSFNHSCAPNLYHVAHKSALFLYSAKDIRPGEELNITYMEFGPKHRVPEARQRLPAGEEARKAGFEKRRGYLEKIFHFECGCSRCAWEISLDRISTSHSDPNTPAASTGVEGVTPEEERFIREGLLCAQGECYGFYAPPDVLDILHETSPSKGGWACVACGHNQN